jgi:uncharacterized coiled-coil protein SlyX
MPTLTEQIRTLNLSAQELRIGSGGTWSDDLIEDYLTILENFIALAGSSDGVVVRVEVLEAEMDAVELRLDNAEARITVNEQVIAQNSLDINANALAIAQNALDITSVTNAFNTHNSSSSQHGVTGVNVGTEDYCTLVIGGVVLLCDLVDDAIESTQTIALPDIAAAPAAYNQAYIQTLANMANDTKLKHNNLVTDLNNAVTQINDLLAKLKAAKQMSST